MIHTLLIDVGHQNRTEVTIPPGDYSSLSNLEKLIETWVEARWHNAKAYMVILINRDISDKKAFLGWCIIHENSYVNFNLDFHQAWEYGLLGDVHWVEEYCQNYHYHLTQRTHALKALKQDLLRRFDIERYALHYNLLHNLTMHERDEKVYKI